MSVYVKTAQNVPVAPNYATAYGTGVSLDFRGLIAPGEQIVGYAVALSYLNVSYATNSGRDKEPVGQLQVILVPSQAGGVIHVDANLILTDYDGDGAGENQDSAGLSTYVSVTAIAYVDTPPALPPPILVGNLWAQSGTATTMTVPPGTLVCAFLAGFNLMLEDEADDIEGLYFEVSGSTNGVTMSVSGNAGFGNPADPASATVQTIDLGYLAAIPSYAGEYLIAAASVSGSGGDPGYGGYIGTLSTGSVAVPSGQWVSGAAVLLQTIDLEMADDERVAFAAAGAAGAVTFKTSSDGTSVSVTAPVVMNLWGGDWISSGRLQCQVLITLGGSADNLVVNPSFETGALSPGWTASGDTGLAGVETRFPRTGNYDAYLNPTTTDGTGLEQVIIAPAASEYTLIAYAATNLRAGVTLTLGSTSHGQATVKVIGDQYTQYQLTVKANAGDTLTIQYQAPAAGAGGGSWAALDDVTLHQT